MSFSFLSLRFKSFCQSLDVGLYLEKTHIAKVVFDIKKEANPCSLCSRMRRGALHNAAKALECNKMALGHHFDDVIETILLSMLYGAEIKTMMPKLHSTNFEGMELIRPMFCVLEEDIVRWQNHNELEFIACACKFVKNVESEEILPTFSARKRVKELIAELKKEHPNVEHCIFQSIHNVQLDTLAEYKQDGKKHSFLERFDEND